jgi:DNA-directed RNA polymerase subunit RPC12/RpoP
MSNSTYFVQECPTCGRHLQIRVEYLGRKVVCQHCRGSLIATDPSLVRLDEAASGSTILRRAEELLEVVSRSRRTPPVR